MFKINKAKSLPTEIRVREGSGFLDVIKGIGIICAIGVLAYNFIPELNKNVSSGDGVVFKNLSNDYDSIENSYDAVLINKPENVSTDANKNIEESIPENAHNVFVIDYVGTVMASEVKYLTAKIDAIILKSNPDDEVVINITSPGGAVSGYGLVASQIQRLKTAGLKITATVDTVAASGGYMAAVVADEIVAAQFSMVGSIGVVANVMIYEELLKNFGIQTNVYTSGDSKRTVVPSRVPTKEEEAKLEAQLEEIHTSFKNHVLFYRPDIDVDKVFTGQAFLSSDALGYGLVDKIGTSDELLLNLYKDGHRLIKVQYQISESMSGSVTKQVSAGLIDAIKTEIFNNSLIIR